MPGEAIRKLPKKMWTIFVFFGVLSWNKGVFEGQKSELQEKSSCHNFYCLLMDEIMLQTMHYKRNVLWMEGSQQNGLVYAVQSNAVQSRVLLLKTQGSSKLKHFV